MTSSTRRRLLATTLLFGTASVATPAWAQNPPVQPSQVNEPVLGQDAAAVEDTAADTDQGEIIVTGSRIVRPNLEANSPIAVVEGERLVANADVTLDTFLNTLPQVNPAGTTTSNNPGNSGQANIDLRGLGSNRNIILVDGRRPMQSGTTTTVGVDLNTIPAALIDRVDVITGGAGAAYGADAVSGVVNLILKSDFQGLDVRATYANTGGTDAREFNASAVLGANFADGRGNAVLAFDYTDRQGLIKRQRPFAALATSTTSFLPEGFYNVGNSAPTQAAVDAVFARYGVAAGGVNAASSGLSFNPDGTLFSPGVFNNPLDVQNFRYPIDLSVNTNFFPDVYSYNFDEVNLLVLPLKRKSFLGKLNFEVSSFFEPFAQVGWTRYSSTTALAPTPAPTVTLRNPNDLGQTNGGSMATTTNVVNGQTVVQFLVVPMTNPFIPADLRQILASRTGDDVRLTGAGADEPFLLRTRTLGAGARLANFTNEVIQYMGGARGEFAPNWRYEAYFSEGHTTIVNQGRGAIDTQRLQGLIDSPTGTVSGCTYNPFGRLPLSSACTAYLEVVTRSQIDFDQKIAQAYITGQIAELPAGAVSVVFGAENRRFRYEVDPGALSGPISGPNVVTAAAGKNSFMDFFGELEVPILRNAPLAEELTVNLSARHSTFKATNLLTNVDAAPSKDWTYGIQLSYAPFQSLRLRGSYQRAVRAPNFTELFAGGNSAPQFYDPCSTPSNFRAGTLGRTAAQAIEFCRVAQQVVPANSSAFASYVQLPGSQLSINFGGNINLRPEKADTFTLGAVFNAPTDTGLLSTLRGSIDYYNIRVKDAIVLADPNSVLAACFNYDGTNPNFDPMNPNCRSLVRSGAQLTQVRNPSAANGFFANSNLAELKTSGIDTQLSWALPFDTLGEGSRFNFDLFLNYLIDWKRKESLPGLPFIDYSGTVGYFGSGLSNGGGASFPKWRGQLNTTWTNDEFSLNLRTRYIHSMINRASVQYVGETSFTGVDAKWYFDLAGTWNIENMTFRLGVNNLFNNGPAIYQPNVQSGTDPSLYDVIGRRYFVSIGLRY